MPKDSTDYILGAIQADVLAVKASQARLEAKLDRIADSHENRLSNVEKTVWKISAVAGVIGAAIGGCWKYITDRVFA